MLTETIEIPAPQPFSLRPTVLSHGWHECAPMSWSAGGACFQIIERQGGRPVRVSVVESRRGKRSVRLRVTVESDAITEALIERIRRELRVVLGLDDDLTEFFELCESHPTLHILPSLGAGRALRSFSMVENTIKALLATNVNWGQAVKMINRLGQLGPYHRDYRNLNAWPTPREILRAGERYLLEVCRVGYRSESILTFCDDVCEGRIDLDAVDASARDPNVDSAEILAQLRSIRGIGPSSAHYLLSMMGRHDRLSIDSATVAHVAKTHTHGRKPTLKRIEGIYASYGRWKNRVWWFEHWLNWDSARQMIREAGLTQRAKERRAG
ncbi:MAG: hypothetical protein IIC02_01615 [Planctomycetes bacterium]|nr:hypothetical protein [Planctomycetota bacterium]